MPSLEEQFAARGKGSPASGTAASLSKEAAEEITKNVTLELKLRNLRMEAEILDSKVRHLEGEEARERAKELLLRAAAKQGIFPPDEDPNVERDPIYHDDIPHR